MVIRSASFVVSNTRVDQCPEHSFPEFAFIGRSNVGKSSLINMLTNIKGLAKTSGRPGKTQLINHFMINEAWYLVDLPGYGFAKASKSNRNKWEQIIAKYFKQRTQLTNAFVLIDSRLEPQKIDLEFINWLGEGQIPFSLVFTKTDKISSNQQQKSVSTYKKALLQNWEEMPPYFLTSAESGIGRNELLGYIEDVCAGLSNRDQTNAPIQI